jgi:autotransporter-associated beta strand protein
MTKMKTSKTRDRATAKMIAASVAASANLILGLGAAHAQTVTSNANYSASAEVNNTTGATSTYVSTSFSAAAPGVNTYASYGAVAFNASSYTSLAANGITSAATLSAYEYSSASASTKTVAGSILNIYFAENPNTTTTLPAYNASAYGPGGFNASNFAADLVGSTTFNNGSGQDAISLTLSSSDVAYVDTVLSNKSGGSFEFFFVVTSSTAAARYDATYTGVLAGLTLNGAAGTNPTGFLTFDPTGTGASGSPNFTTNSAVTDFTDSGTGKDVPFVNGNTVTFTDAALSAGSAAISIDPAGVAPAAVTVNTTGTYTFTGTGTTGITGSATLTKSGTGTLVINNTNSYTGGTTITGGTISVSLDAALGTGNIALNGGTLAVTGPITEAAGTTAAGAPVRSVTLGGSGGTINTGGNALVFGGALSGSGALLLTGTSGGSATFLTETAGSTIGALNISSGSTLALQNASATPYITIGAAAASPITINGALNLGTAGSPVTLEFAYGNTYNGSGSITTSGTIRTYYNSTSAFAVTVNPSVVLNGSANQLIEADFNKSIAFNNTVSGGSAGVTIGVTPDIYNGNGVVDALAGPGKVTFNAAATYTGPTTLTAGTLVVNSTLASSAVSVAAPTTLTYNSGSVTYSPTLAGTGTVRGPVSLAGAMTAGSGATSTDTIGGLNLSGGLTVSGSAASYAVKLNGGAPAAAYNSGSSSGGTAGTSVTGSDKLILSSLVASGAVLTINPVVLSGTSLTPGLTYSFVIADDTASATAFNALIPSGGGSSIVLGTGDGFSTYALDTKPDGGSGEDLLLDITAAAPEPTSLLLVGAAAGPLVLNRRRRRSPTP